MDNLVDFDVKVPKGTPQTELKAAFWQIWATLDGRCRLVYGGLAWCLRSTEKAWSKG